MTPELPFPPIELRLISFDNPAPPLIFAYKFFCFTGHFLAVKRKACEKTVIEKGGIVQSDINMVTNYLVIGRGLYEFMDKAQGFLNNKMEGALARRAAGGAISIISEDHFAANMVEVEKNEPDDFILIESFTTSGMEYRVHLQRLTCTCPNFHEDREGFSMDDPRRLCKHLVKGLVDKKYVHEKLRGHVEKISIASLYKGGIPGY